MPTNTEHETEDVEEQAEVTDADDIENQANGTLNEAKALEPDSSQDDEEEKPEEVGTQLQAVLDEVKALKEDLEQAKADLDAKTQELAAERANQKTRQMLSDAGLPETLSEFVPKEDDKAKAWIEAITGLVKANKEPTAEMSDVQRVPRPGGDTLDNPADQKNRAERFFNLLGL